MKIIPFRPRRPDCDLAIALAIFQSLRPGVDAPSTVLEAFPDLSARELFDGFSRAHHILSNFQRMLLAEIAGSDDGGAA